MSDYEDRCARHAHSTLHAHAMSGTRTGPPQPPQPPPPRLNSAYWIGLISSAAKLAIQLHGAPKVQTYQRMIVQRMGASPASSALVADSTALVDLLCQSCRVEVNALRHSGRTRALCYVCAEEAAFEALLWSDRPQVLETVHACARHVLDTQCAWYLLTLPLLVYHSVRLRRTWKHPALATRRAETDYLGVCAFNATVATHRLGLS